MRLGYILTDITNTPRTNYGRKRKQLIKQFGLPQDSDVVPAHHLYAIIQSYTKGNSSKQTKQSAKKVIEYLGLKAMGILRISSSSSAAAPEGSGEEGGDVELSAEQQRDANLDAIATMTGVAREDVLLSEWSGRLFRPGYFLAVDRAQRAVVVAFRA